MIRHTGGHVRLGRISLSGGGKHFIAARVHHRRQHRDPDPERLPTPVTAAGVGDSGGEGSAEPSTEVRGGAGQP